VEDEEIWRERRRQQSEEVAIAVERAKQRKEEEEKRYQEQLKQVCNAEEQSKNVHRAVCVCTRAHV